MEVTYQRCAGLDVHKKELTACVMVSTSEAGVHKEIRSFGTMTQDLLELADWLEGQGVSHVAMESTGVYWKPIYNLLEERFELLLVNAQHIKAVPGRKTDVKDAEWIADLLRHGLLRASLVPDKTQRELRELTRYRTSLVREWAAEVNRLQKTLEVARGDSPRRGANIKLGSVASDVMGVSGHLMLKAIIAGQDDPSVLADLAQRQLRDKLPELMKALQGRLGPHQRFMLAQQLEHIEFLDGVIAQLSQEIAERLRPFEEDLERLDGIPGVGRTTAEVILAELGTDMSRFPTPAHAASWAGMAPGNNESAGKRKSAKVRKGSPWLRNALTESGKAAGKKKDSHLSSKYRRIKARRGGKKAGIAVGHTILLIAYDILLYKRPYKELGDTYYDQRRREARCQHLTKELRRLGYEPNLTPVGAAA
ncbi:MAG: IS110 family transposase [Bacteroidetes bacterium]|nr:IS110 family transposase [Bacteroidota bacterium]MCL5027268.1 IS110 family transposase [Chloroflexota bacterium]